MVDNRVVFLKRYGELRQKLELLILGNVNISIREGERELWNCNEDVWKDKKFRNFKVVQSFDVEDFLLEMLHSVDELNACLKELTSKRKDS